MSGVARSRPPDRPAFPLLVASGALLLLILPAVSAAGPTSQPRPDSGLSLSGTPTSGVAPLVVAFQLRGPNSTVPTMVDWSFGDGEYLNGSGSAYESVSHEYDLAGNFTCRAVATFSYGTLNASLPVSVRASSLRATIVATPLNGTYPLTVQFNATPSGGSGTYLAELWDFGDGGNGSGLGLQYTYATAGRFNAVFTLTDSTNHSASASVVINVTAPPPPPPKLQPGPNSSGSGDPALVTLVALGAAAASVAGLVGVVLWARSSRRSLDAIPPPSLSPATPAEQGSPVPPEPPVVPAVPRAGPGPPSLPGAQQLSFQILRHLASQPRLGPSDLPTPAFTQSGIAAAVGADQSAVSRVLRRLASSGVVRIETTHVAGGARRLRVYQLTERGERLGRALRDAAGTASPQAPGGTGGS